MDFKFQISHFRFLTAAILALFFCAPFLRAADVEVSASLSESSTEVGQPVQFQIKVSGARSATPPEQIATDGLSISFSGQSQSQQLDFNSLKFNVTTSVVYTYQVIPQRPGEFTIHSQIVEVGGKKYTTTPVTLEVTGSGNSGGGNTAGTSTAGGKQVFAELVMPKQTAYVGEVVPVEFRIYVDSRIRWQTQQPPTIGGEGFTIQKFTKPQQNQVTKDGRTYDVVIFKTAITAAKAGDLKLGPAQLICVAQVPQPRRRTGSPFDNFFNDDAFADAFGFGQAQQLTIKSESLDIEVKSLPTANQPKDFSGAVGSFTLADSVSPTTVKAGDPITLTTKITGRGNFDRVNAPQIEEESGWQSYPPSGKFQADDDVGISGTKTFETAVIPEEPKTKLPPVHFSYFDPVAEKYVTLTGEPMRIAVKGQVAPPPPIASGSAAIPAVAAESTPAPVLRPNDILYIHTDATKWGESFTPIYRSRAFWLAQLAPLAALVAFAGVQISRTKKRDESARQPAEWRREKAELMKRLTARGADDGAFFDNATRCIQLAAALRLGRNPSLIDANEACSARKLDEATAERVRKIFAAHGEMRYAGGGRGGAKLSPEMREEVLETLKRFEEEPAHV